MNTTAPLALGSLLLAALPATAQDQEELISRREAKFAKPWIEAGGWITDWAEAQKQAQETGKDIFAYFSRSFSP